MTNKPTKMNQLKIFITFLLLLVFTYAKGQDKIVTTQNDTIFCKVLSVSLEFIKYEQKINNQAPVENSIPMKQVQEYSLGPRTGDASLASSGNTQVIQPSSTFPDLNRKKVTKTFQTPVKKPKAPSFDSFSRWRFGVQGGEAYLINSLAHSRQAMKDLGVFPAAQADNYYKKLRKGISFDADVHYLISQPVGIGVKYSFFTSSVQMDYTVRDNNSVIPTYLTASEKENFYLQYVGPSVLFQQWLGGNHKFRINEQLSAGYFIFRYEERFDPYQYVFVNPNTGANQYSVLKKGNTFGGNFQLSLEYYPVRELSVALNAGVFPTTFRSLKVSDNSTSYTQNLGKSHSLDLSRVDVSIGIRYHF
jgi:hypothetical protein